MRVAVLFSPEAGNKKKFHDIGSVLTHKLSNHTVFTGQGCFGKLYLPDATEIAESAVKNYRSRIAFITTMLCRHDPEMFICVGGDGLAAYAADTLTSIGVSMPVMGIAAGTANVGPIIAFRPEELNSFDPENLIFSAIGAIHIKNGDRHIGYAFNDAIIGNTFLGTINGETTNMSVRALLEGNKKLAVTPLCNITDDRFSITKNGMRVKFTIKSPAQIIISPLEVDKFYGRAITGALCFSAYSPLKAAMGLFEEVIVKNDNSSTYAEQFTKAEHLLFGPGDLISITGLSEEGQIIIDGNPYLRENEIVTFEYKPRLISVAKPLAE